MLKDSKDDLLEWLNYQRNKYEGLPCEFLPILSTDKNTEYRNKCEFTVGKSTIDLFISMVTLNDTSGYNIITTQVEALMVTKL